jgi:flavodoxin I
MTTGLIFGSTNGEVESVAQNIKADLGDSINLYENIGNIVPQTLESCDNLILGISTWDIGQLQADWDVFWPKLDQTNFSGKKVAIFGMGDQVGYPDTYQDATGMLYDKVVERGATVVGLTSPEGQEFTATKVMLGDKMKGLCLDMTNQPDRTDERVAAWVKQIVGELGLGQAGGEVAQAA